MPFNGIRNLRSANESVKLEMWQLQEIERCTKDPIYFIRHYVYINTKDEGTQLMKTYPFQDEAIRRFLKYRFNINRWSRQVGKSTIVRAFILWYAMFHEDQLIAMLANKLMLAKEQLQLLRESYLNLPFWLQPGVKLWNKMSIQFANGCRIIIAASSSDGIRGFSPNLLYLDEFAFLRPGMADEFMASVFPTISSGKKTRVIITSCVVKDTMVFTPDGIKTVGDFIIDDGRELGYEVPEYQVLGRYGMNRGHIMHNDGDPKETRIIRTRYSEVETSLMHKFWSCRDGEYKIRRAHELRVGDYVMVKYGMNCWGNDKIDYDDTKEPLKYHLGKISEITEELAYLFGLYIAEGNAQNTKRSKYVNITCGDDISTILNQLGLHYSCYDSIHYRISSKSLVMLFEQVGFDLSLHAITKVIPPRLLHMSKKCVAAMLRGMFDGDGTTDLRRKRIGYTSTSKKLIDQIRILLANFGILSTVSDRHTKPTKKVKVVSHVWNIEINQQAMVEKFFEEIGFGFNRKQMRSTTQNGRKNRPSRYDYIPYAASEIRRLKKEKILTNNEFKLTGGICDKNDVHLNRKLVLDIKSKLPEEVWAKYAVFRNAEPDCIWTQITNIDTGYNKVYDFSLDDDNFDGYGDDGQWAHSVVHNLLICAQTPAGMNHFYRMWEDAVDEATATAHDLQAKYVRSTVLWNEVPGRDEQWGLDEKLRCGEERFRQEYECEFIGSAVTLIDYRTLQHLHPDKPMAHPRIPDDYQLRIYGRPLNPQQMEMDESVYIAALDTGYGMRQDYHVLQILYAKSSTKLEQVLTLSSNSVTVEDFCAVSFALLRKYHFPALTIEYNGGSGALAYQTMTAALQYPNMVDYDSYFRGMYSTTTTKSQAVMLLKTYIQKNYLLIHDEKTINELMSFTRPTKNTWGASGGNHDDHVTSLYWAVYHAYSPYFQGKMEEISLDDVVRTVFAPAAEIADMRNVAEQVRNPQIVQEQRGIAELAGNQRMLPQVQPQPVRATVYDGVPQQYQYGPPQGYQPNMQQPYQAYPPGYNHMQQHPAYQQQYQYPGSYPQGHGYPQQVQGPPMPSHV